MNELVRPHRAGLAASLAAALGALFAVLPDSGRAAPGDVLFADSLDADLGAWTVVRSIGDARITGATSRSGNSLELRWGTVSVSSDPFNADVPAARLDVWVRRGDDSFSEDPDGDEDLVIEFRDDAGNWTVLQTYGGDDGSPGDVYTPAIVLPANALHAALQIRFRHTGSDGDDWDYWHVDDVTVTETAPAPGFGLGSCETFEAGLGDWTVLASGGSAGTSSATAASGTRSLFTRWDEVAVSSGVIDLSAGYGVDLAAWVRRGDDSFSEDPDGSENLVVEYLDDADNWIVLETFTGSGDAGEIYTPVYALPAAALHAGFRLRFRQTGGDGSDNDYWHVDDVCLTGSQAAVYRFEESAWTGAAGEVADSGPGSLDGSVLGGASNPQSTPAVAGNPGTCRYADFDGVDDYIEVADDSALDLRSALTVGVWVNARSIPAEGLHTIVSKDWNYEFHIDSAGRIYWWWNDESGAEHTLTSSLSIATNQWHHVAITYAAGAQVIYLDGNPVATSSRSENLRLNDLPLYIGTDYDFISRAWDGYLDEVNVFNRALSQTDVQALMLQTHPCETVQPLFTINHDRHGIHCLAETIVVDVVDAAAGTPLTDYNATVVLDTQSGRGTWQRLSGSGGFADATGDDGLARYDWPLGESQAVFSLSYPAGNPTLDLDVYQQIDPGIRDNDAEGLLAFSPSGFTLTAAPLPNPVSGPVLPFASPQVAGSSFAINVAAFGQTPADPECGVIESYTGSKPLAFWMAYENPGTGARVASIDGASIASAELVAVTTTVEFTNGQASVVAKYKDVGRISISVKDESPADPDLANGIRGATAGFVVKPFDFVLSNIADAGGNANPAAADATGPVFVAAGEAFAATVTARDAEGDATPNYGRENVPESIALTPLLVAPVAGDLPPVAAPTGFAGFVDGSATATDLSWPEVGIVTLTPEVADGDYLGAGNVTGPASPAVGRFVPHHFDISQNTPLLATACAAGGFTYVGQPFGYAVEPVASFTARALAGELTENYDGAFFRMTAASLADPVYAATSGTLDTAGLPGGAGAPAVASLGSGRGTLTYSSGSGLGFVKSAPVPEFNAEISLSQVVTDADGVAAIANPMAFGASGGMLFDSGAAMRDGRLRAGNGYGSELVDLSMPLVSEYYFGAAVGYVHNTADSCTTPVSVALGAYTENLSPGETCVLDDGAPGASGAGCAAAAAAARRFSAPPSAGNFNLWLAAPGQGNEGSVDVGIDAPDWLQFDWDAGNAGLEDPSASAVFGIFGGGGKMIYRRELY